MLQHYVTEHAHTQSPNKIITATTAPAAGSMACFSVGAAKAISTQSETYLLNVAHTGIAGNMGYYAAQALELVPGYSEMCSVCSVAVVINNLPFDAVVMPFATTVDLSTGPALPINSPSNVWYPCAYDSLTYDTTSPGRQIITMRSCFPVENDVSTARWFGLAIFGTFTAAARTLQGAISLRQVKTEFSVFMPNK